VAHSRTLSLTLSLRSHLTQCDRRKCMRNATSKINFAACETKPKQKGVCVTAPWTIYLFARP